MLADSGGIEQLIIVGIFIAFGVISALAKWIRSKQEQKESRERRLRRGEGEAERASSGSTSSGSTAEEPQQISGLESLLKALEGSARGQGPRPPAEEEAWPAAESAEEPVMHEVEGELWDVTAETRERGLTTMDPHTLEERRRRDRESRRAASLEKAAASVAEQERRAREAVEEARRAAAGASGSVSAEGYAERVLAEEAEARAREIAAAIEGGLAGDASAQAFDWGAPAAGRGASRQAVRSGMVWSFILGAPRAIAAYGEEETSSAPGLRPQARSRSPRAGG